MRWLWLLLALGASDVEEEKAQLKERLEAEKTAFEALTAQRESLLSLLDTLQRLARDSTARAQGLERGMQRLEARLNESRAEAAAMAASRAELERALGPRLLTLYRLERKSSLATLLSASDFAGLVKRERAMKTLVASDVHALEELGEIDAWQKLEARRLDRLEGSAQRYVKALRQEQAVGRARLERFQELLTSISAEQNREGRVIAELEASEKELSAMVSDMATTGTTGFRARKGHLPYPAKGIVEVGFGKVVNPRFNTVTVQKGLDLRAAAGTPVVAISAGSVVFAGWMKGYGNLVILDHGGAYHSLYAHLEAMEVEVGNEVEEGVTLGQVGDTGSLKGAYLYFEIRKQGQAVDPLPWLASE
jgi:septal ring factor EnvC (AmiA/AmiB activator)